MNASDAVKKTDKRSMSESKLNRDATLNPSEYDVGMGDDEDYSDFFNNDTGDTNSVGTGTTDFNNMQFGQMGLGTFGTMPQPIQETKKETTEEILGKIAIAFLKGCWEFIKSFVKSFKDLSPRFWTKLGAWIIVLGCIYGLLGIILMIIKKDISWDFLIAGILCIMTGVIPLTFMYDRAKEEDGTSVQKQSLGTFNFSQSQTNTDLDDEILLDDEDYDDLLFEDEEETLLFDEEVDLFEVTREHIAPPINMEDVLKNIDIPNKGLYTRQFLFDAIYPVLMNITPEYEKFKDLDENSETFDALNHIVVTSAKLQSGSNDEPTYLIKASENLQFIKLDVKRTKGIKNLQLFCSEIADIFKVDEESGIIPEENEGIYATGITVGDKIIIKLFKGDGSMVSVKDIMAKVRTFFLDVSNKMPCILGIDSYGQTVVRDFKDIESMLITGFPRSGKTWFVLSIVTQLCMWSSPRDVWFIVCDPKNKISDFKNFSLPHMREFITADDEIVEKLRYLVKVEAKRREDIIGDVNKVNIWDFKKENPDIDLPIIYVIVDEVVTLADRMDKETKAAYQGYLRELVTRLPALGIRAMLIPHVIKHDILNKTTTDVIQFRVSVKGDSKHILNNLGVKDFQHLLRRRGDMAVKLPDTDCKFVRAAVLSDDNDKNQELFNFLRKLWTKIEPDFDSGSVAKEAEIKEELSKLTKKSMSDVDEFFKSE